MSDEQNKALVQRFVEEFWNRGNMAAADEMMAEEVKISLPGIGPVDKETFKGFATAIRVAFPDWFSTAEVMIGEGDRLAEQWTGRGTHLGEFQGITPTGRKVTVPGSVFYRIQSGRIVEFQGIFDGLSLQHQLETPRGE